MAHICPSFILFFLGTEYKRFGLIRLHISCTVHGDLGAGMKTSMHLTGSRDLL